MSAEYDLSDLLGRSIHDERVVAALKRHHAAKPDAVFDGSAFYGHAKETGFGLSAEAVRSYRQTIGEPRSVLTDDPAELIVTRVDFSDTDCAEPGSAAYRGGLPFGLRFGDLAETVTERLGVKPRRKSRSGDLPGRSPVVFVWDYRVGETVAIVKLTDEHRLAALYLLPVDRQEQQVRERKASLKQRSRMIDPHAVEVVEALRGAMPTTRWREAAAEPDTDMAMEEVEEAEALLHLYVDAIKSAVEKRSAAAVHQATKRLVTGLNRLNRRNGLIETLERDELGSFIDSVVTATGLAVELGEDVTMPWREW